MTFIGSTPTIRSAGMWSRRRRGGGNDLLDLSSTSDFGVRVNLSLGEAQVVNANLTLVLSSPEALEDIYGGDRGDVLLGNARPTGSGAGRATTTWPVGRARTRFWKSGRGISCWTTPAW